MNVISLNSIVDIHQFGAKGANLSKMKRKGFPVPDGFVISSNAFKKYHVEKENIDELIFDIENELKRIGAKKYMVRSSAIGEDSDENSFAGQLESFISNNTINEILINLKKCWDSYNKENVKAYQKHTGKKLNGMGVVIQKLIEPDYAGVIFTKSHLKSDEMLVEYVQGHGEKLVSGAETPKCFHFSTKNKFLDKDYLVELKEGLKIAERIEQFYGNPTDIEWAIKNNEFFVVQARPITTKLKELALPVYKQEIYWSNTNVNENYPDPISPLLYSVARQAYYHYFKNLSKLFGISPSQIRELEAEYANVIGAFGCKMYYNMSSIHKILSASPFSEMLIKSFDNFVGYGDGNKGNKKNSSFGEKIKFLREFFRYNRNLEKNVSEFEGLVDNYSLMVKEAKDYGDFRRSFNEFIEIRMHSWYRASLADFFAMVFHGSLGKFCSKYYHDEGVGIQNKLIQAIPGIISSKPVIDMHNIIKCIRNNKEVYDKFHSLNAIDFYKWVCKNDSANQLAKLISNYLEEWGFRCSGELMLTAKNYIEEPESFIALLMQYEKLPDQDPSLIIEKKYHEAKKSKQEFIKTIYKKNWWFLPKAIIHHWKLNYLCKNAIKGISARERARLKQAHLYFGFKQTIQKIEEEFINKKSLKNKGDILFLSTQEITESIEASSLLSESLIGTIELRKQEFQTLSQQKFPDDFYTVMGVYTSPEDVINKEFNSSLTGGLKGLCACGGNIKGTVKVLESVLEASKLNKGDILVTRQTDPGWVVVFPLISGLIVERGGMLSHGAIVSREFGIPAIVGVENATTLLKDGDYVLLNADKGEIIIL